MILTTVKNKLCIYYHDLWKLKLLYLKILKCNMFLYKLICFFKILKINIFILIFFLNEQLTHNKKILHIS